VVPLSSLTGVALFLASAMSAAAAAPPAPGSRPAAASSRTAATTQPFRVPDFAAAIQGCWRQEGNEPRCVRIDGEQFLFAQDGRLQIVGTIIRYEPNRMIVRFHGQRVPYGWRLESGMLGLGNGDGTGEQFERLAQVPPELDLKPLALGPAGPVEANRLRLIQRELARRMVDDQAVRKDLTHLDEMQAVDANNTAYLRGLLAEIGWIDANRFGAPTAQAAFLIVQHSGDLPLMLAALPCIERDMKAGHFDAQPYAMLYDRVQVNLGRKQRYGTQLSGNDKGERFVLPLEDRKRVDEFRKEIGLFPMSKYLSLFGKEVKYAEDEE
jgi:hypothetical protein